MSRRTIFHLTLRGVSPSGVSSRTTHRRITLAQLAAESVSAPSWNSRAKPARAASDSYSPSGQCSTFEHVPREISDRGILPNCFSYIRMGM